MLGEDQPLFGGCTCGRNQYTVILPSTSSVDGQPILLIEESIDSSRSDSSSLPTFLRVPISSIHSTTYAFYDDETHSDIRRIFTPRHSPHTKRHFCGFCGTPLTVWTESEPQEAEYIRVSLRSLERPSLELLDELGLLEPETSDEEEQARGNNGLDGGSSIEVRPDQGRAQGHPWSEETIESTHLGRVRRRKGGKVSADGNSKVDWEIVEIGEDDEGDVPGSSSSVKRKIESVLGNEDVIMRGGR